MHHKATSSSVRRIAALALILGPACAGAKPDGDGPSGPSGPKPVPDDGTRGTPLIALGERLRAEGQCEAPMVAPQPLRRLSRLEYDNAVRDLLGDDSRPAAGFVAEEKVAGFNSNSASTVSALSVEQYLNAAEGIAERAVSRIAAITGCNDEANKTCVKAWLTRNVRRAFRGTWPDEERKGFEADFDALSDDVKAAFAYGVTHMLTSHRFLFTLETGAGASGVVPLTGPELAGRLALTLWRSVPDDALLEAADQGRLNDAPGVRAEAERLLEDSKADAALADFAVQWLNVEQAPATKDPARFPQYTPTLGQAMLEETRRFFLAVAHSQDGNLKELLTADYTFANRDLGALYNEGSSLGEGFARMKLPTERRGVLTQAAVLANAAHVSQSSPVLRGILVREHLLCDPVQPPPPGVDTTVEPVAGKSDQEVFDAHADKPACSGCHKYLDPIGKGFAAFDAIGAFTAGADVSGHIEPPELSELPDDVSGPFSGAVALSAKLADSLQVQQCYALQTMRWALAREERTADACALHDLWQGFSGGGLGLRQALLSLVSSSAFRHRTAVGGGQSCQ